MTIKILLLLFYVLFPALIIWAESRYDIVKKIGAIGICYVGGVIIGIIGIPSDSVRPMQDFIEDNTVLLAIPLLLFSMNIRGWFKMARATFMSLVLGLVSALAMIFLGYFLFRDQIPEIEKIAGMLTGIYTGGQPNLAAINNALDVEEFIYMKTITYDMLIGAVLLIFLLTFAHRFFLLFLRPWKPTDTASRTEGESSDAFSSYDGIFKAPALLQVAIAFGLALIILLISRFVESVVPAGYNAAAAVITSTILGILASLVPAVNRLRMSFQTGMFLILIFCVVIPSKTNPDTWLVFDWPLLWYVFLAVIGALMFHAFLSWIFNVDADNMIIATTALSMAPPFVPAVAAAIKNRDIILSGIMIGAIGYAIGNFAGIFIGGVLGYF